MQDASAVDDAVGRILALGAGPTLAFNFGVTIQVMTISLSFIACGVYSTTMPCP
jgi:uncharacterized membrane protein YdfJ with MMPL/SSD domain